MDKLKLDIQKFALDPPMAGNIIDEVCLHRYHQNIKRDYAKKDSDNNFANLVVDSIRTKNMFDMNEARNGAITVNSTSESLDYNTNSLTTGWIPCKPNTQYTISGSYNRSRWQTKSSDETITYGGENQTTITTNSTAKYLRFYYYYGSAGTVPSDVPNFQVEEGDTATTYTPHQNLDGISQVVTGSATVNSTYISNAENNAWEKTGKVVVYHFTLTVTGTWNNTTQFLSRLPKPISYTRFMALDSSNNEPLRIGIDTNGNAYNAWSAVTPSSGHIIEGLVTYITSD